MKVHLTARGINNIINHLLVVFFSLWASTALAQAVENVIITPATFSSLLKMVFTPEILTVVVFKISGWATSPITAFLKKMFKTSGDSTKQVNAAVSGVIAGLIPFALGAYGYSWLGALYALAVASVRTIVDQGAYNRQANIVARGTRDNGIRTTGGDIVEAILPSGGPLHTSAPDTSDYVQAKPNEEQ